ncbi:MAG TPA: hypothetical protein P5277_00190 [Candidatus Paceibacterota bacterium]|nr:hypothetical protein [Candidatus Paceibacterota bacterium]
MIQKYELKELIELVLTDEGITGFYTLLPENKGVITGLNKIEISNYLKTKEIDNCEIKRIPLPFDPSFPEENIKEVMNLKSLKTKIDEINDYHFL